MKTQILIVDDRAVVRAELRNLLELSGTITVVGEAENGWEAIRQAEALHPDIVLMDLEMPGMDGFEATLRIKNQRLARVVIVFSVHGSAQDQQRAKEAGADAYIVKGTDLFTILKTFEQFSQQEV